MITHSPVETYWIRIYHLFFCKPFKDMLAFKICYPQQPMKLVRNLWILVQSQSIGRMVLLHHRSSIGEASQKGNPIIMFAWGPRTLMFKTFRLATSSFLIFFFFGPLDLSGIAAAMAAGCLSIRWRIRMENTVISEQQLQCSALSPWNSSLFQPQLQNRQSEAKRKSMKRIKSLTEPFWFGINLSLPVFYLFLSI